MGKSRTEMTPFGTRIKDEIRRQGWSYILEFQPFDDGGTSLTDLAREFGEPLEVSEDGSLIVETEMLPTASVSEPFNRPERIGWHNDFSTWPERPVLSMASVVSSPERGSSGDWLVVGIDLLLKELLRSAQGRRAVALLERGELPFCFAQGEDIRWFRVLDAEAGANRVRYYGRALRLGAELAGLNDSEVFDACETWEYAAETVGVRCPAETGALLVCNNWRSMHDRLEQSAGRRSRLCFVTGAEDV